MSAVKTYAELDKSVTSKISPCPVDERVCLYYDVPGAFIPGLKTGKDNEYTDDSGVHFQRCGGGRRVIRRKITG